LVRPRTLVLISRWERSAGTPLRRFRSRSGTWRFNTPERRLGWLWQAWLVHENIASACTAVLRLLLSKPPHDESIKNAFSPQGTTPYRAHGLASGAMGGSMGAGYRSSRSTHPANSRLAGNVPLNALDNDLVATCELPPGVTCRRSGRTSVVARSRNEWSVSALTVKAQPEIARVY
jgi:hypothetical protein